MKNATSHEFVLPIRAACGDFELTITHDEEPSLKAHLAKIMESLQLVTVGSTMCYASRLAACRPTSSVNAVLGLIKTTNQLYTGVLHEYLLGPAGAV